MPTAMHPTSTLSRKRIKLPEAYPAKAASQVLEDTVRNYLHESELSVGGRFLTDREVVADTGLSISTVRRALGRLQESGWLERRAGAGTFVGRRVLDSRRAEIGSNPVGGGFAVVLGNNSTTGRGISDWLTAGVLEGIRDATTAASKRMDLVTFDFDSPDSVRDQLTDLKAAAVLLASTKPASAVVIRDALDLGLPCVSLGLENQRLKSPCVSEDNAQCVKLAVDHCVAHGHRRIGLVLPYAASEWVLERQMGFWAALAEHEIGPDEASVTWLPPTRKKSLFPAAIASCEKSLRDTGVTAVISGCYRVTQVIGALVQAGKLKVPETLSLVCLDQQPEAQYWLNGTRPTVIELPLHEIGLRLVEMAFKAIQEQPIEPVTRVPCRLIEGRSMMALR